MSGLGVLLLLIATQSSPQAGGLEDGFLELPGSRARVVYVAGDSARSSRILALAEAQSPLAGLPPGLPNGVSIYVVRDEGTFDRVTGGRIPDWGAGVAIPSQRRIVLPLYATGRGNGVEIRRVLRHEWAHLGLHQHLDGLRVPRWFDEGYAQWASGGWDAMEGWRLRVAFATGRAPSLDSLELSWPRDRASAELAYGLSATVLEYLVEESGVRGLEVLLSRWPDQGFDGAVRSTYGVTLGQLEGDWQKYVRKRYGWLLALSHSVLFWIVLSGVLMVMVLIRRRRDREAMARLVAAEGPDRPAFWMTDGEDPPTAAAPDAGATRKPLPSSTTQSWTGGPPRLVWSEPLSATEPPPESAPKEQPEGSNDGGSGYDRSDPDNPDE